MERAIALNFLRNQNEDDDDDDDDNDDLDGLDELGQIAKRFLLGNKDKNKTKDKTPAINKGIYTFIV